MLKGFKKAFLLAGLTSVIVMALVFIVVKAGNFNPPAMPAASTMHSLLEIYNSIAGDEITYSGLASTNDLIVGGTFDNIASVHFAVEIDAISPNTFKWSDDGGNSWTDENVAIDGNPYSISHGLTLNFAPATVHIVGDRWDFYKQIADENGNIVQQLKYISGMTLQQIYDKSTIPVTISDSSNESILTIKQTGAGKIIDLTDGSNSVFSVDQMGKIYGASGVIQAAQGNTFYTEGGNPIRAVGEEIFRASMPILGYDYPAQTANSSSFLPISRPVVLDEGASNSFPLKMEGTDRVYKIGLRYATNISTVNSTWRVYNVDTNSAVNPTFTIPATSNTNLDLNNGTLYIIPANPGVPLPASGTKWRLEVQAPAGGIIRVYSIELMAYDVVKAAPTPSPTP